MLKEFFIGGGSTVSSVKINISTVATVEELCSNITDVFSILPKDGENKNDYS